MVQDRSQKMWVRKHHDSYWIELFGSKKDNKKKGDHESKGESSIQRSYSNTRIVSRCMLRLKFAQTNLT